MLLEMRRWSHDPCVGDSCPFPATTHPRGFVFHSSFRSGLTKRGNADERLFERGLRRLNERSIMGRQCRYRGGNGVISNP